MQWMQFDEDYHYYYACYILKWGVTCHTQAGMQTYT